ncbi:hypothetical protein PIB30_006095 [Stylosanthes scabra]|uniref:NAC domain-containing protein n=1 Tax=Stylosanthes scabra TaxID=79078 RepID=A0ABU6V4Z3_9FABA|nr:hypothetical protein [Stylosanthes scabra]
MGSPESNLPPGFRFHPTDEELILHYLRKKVASIPLPVSIIAEVDIYKLNPWELPAKAAFGEKEWYFFSPRDRKYPNGARPNRAAASGYWKATGTDKTIVVSPATVARRVVGQESSVGVKKALVFYKGRPPKGIKTNWIMHEYRLVDNNRPIKLKDTSMRLDDWVLCRIYKKSKFSLSSLEESSPSNITGDQVQAAEEDSLFKETILKSPIPMPSPPLPPPSLLSQKSVSFSNLLDAMDYSMLSSILSENNNNNNSSLDHQQQYSSSQSSQINTNINTNQLNNSSSLLPNNMENSYSNTMMMKSSKRQLSNMEDETMTVLHPSKKYHHNHHHHFMGSSSCSFPNNINNTINTAQFENPQWNYLVKQSFLNQQLLLGPHLQFQG